MDQAVDDRDPGHGEAEGGPQGAVVRHQARQHEGDSQPEFDGADVSWTTWVAFDIPFTPPSVLTCVLANIDSILDHELEQKLGKMAVVVCGNGSLSDDVRRAVRNKVHCASIDFIEEAFSW